MKLSDVGWNTATKIFVSEMPRCPVLSLSPSVVPSIVSPHCMKTYGHSYTVGCRV